MLEIKKYFSYQKYLSEELDRRCAANLNYSSRAFARDLDVSPSTLSNVLSFKKKLGVKAASAMVDNLRLKGESREYFRALVNSQIDSNLNNRMDAIAYLYRHGLFHRRKEFKDSSLYFLDNWYSLIIFSALDIEQISSNPSLLLDTLGISNDELEQCIDKMIELGLAERSANGLNKLLSAVEFNTDLPGTSIQKFHLSQSIKAQELLLTKPVEDRNFRHVSFSVNKKYHTEIAKKVSEFVDDIARYQELDVADSLVAININSLFFNIPVDNDQGK